MSIANVNTNSLRAPEAIVTSVRENSSDLSSALREMDEMLQGLQSDLNVRIFRNQGALFPKWKALHFGMSAIGDRLNSEHPSCIPLDLKEKFEGIKHKMQVMFDREDYSYVLFPDDRSSKTIFHPAVIGEVGEECSVSWDGIHRKITDLNNRVNKLFSDMSVAIGRSGNSYRDLKGAFSREWKALFRDGKETFSQINSLSSEEMDSEGFPQRDWQAFKRQMNNAYFNYSRFLFNNASEKNEFSPSKMLSVSSPSVSIVMNRGNRI